MRDLNLKVIGLLFLALLILATGFLAWWFSRPPAPTLPPEKEKTKLKKEQKKVAPKNVATGLAVPWALDFLPDGRLIFTERQGNVKLMAKGKPPLLLARISKVRAVGEGGLLGIAVHPRFNDNHFIYLYYTYAAKNQLFNKVVRYKLDGSTLVQDKVIVDKIPGAANHNGGRIKFGPEGLLYITTGDAQKPMLAQDKSSLAGKILRFQDNGDIPKNNPFSGSPLYSFGHRNPQGLAWDKKKQLWATEHGSAGEDEVNLIKPGYNYGWPIISGSKSKPGLRKPIIHSGSQTWAPAGAAFFKGKLFFAGLRGEALFRFKMQKPAQLRRFFAGQFGRLRDVVVGPDNFLYLSTSNRDGRGAPTIIDDRIIKINPAQL